MGQEDTCEVTNAEEGFVKFSSLVQKENGKVSSYDSVGFDVIGVTGIGISEGVANVENDVKSGISRAKDDGDVKRIDEIVGVKRADVEISDNALTIDRDGTKSGEKVSDGESSDSESECEALSESEFEASGESEPETLSPSLSSSSSEEEEDDDDDDEEEELKEKAWEEGEVDVNGMIEDLIVRELFDWSDEDEVFAKAGPFMSANEVKVLPPVAVTLQPCHKTLPVGVVLSVVGAQVIVEGVEKHNPLNEGSILWITEKRCLLGIVDEIFGPVKNPYYIVRYNSGDEVPAGIQQGTLISFVSEFVNHVLNNGNLYKKGYDASGGNDEELSDEAEFSDDEKESEYKRMQKLSKRGQKAQIVETRKDNRSKAKRRGDQHLSATEPNKRVGEVTSNQIQQFPPSSLLDPGNCSNSLQPFQAFSGGPGFVPMFPQVTPVLGFVGPCTGVWMNGIPFQPAQIMGFPNGSTPNNILQFQQNNAQQPYQMPSFNGMPLQQFSSGQMLPSNFVLPGGQPSFGAGATLTPINPMMMGQNNFGQLQAAMSQNYFSQLQAAIYGQGQHGMNFSQAQAPVGMQGQHALTFTSQGEQVVLRTGCHSEHNSNSPPLSATSWESQDFDNAVGVGLARNLQRKGGGGFGGGRGRRQPR